MVLLPPRPINAERVLVDPRAVFEGPVEVLACPDLDVALKRIDDQVPGVGPLKDRAPQITRTVRARANVDAPPACGAVQWASLLKPSLRLAMSRSSHRRYWRSSSSLTLANGTNSPLGYFSR
jgi:hypothetical protein